MNRRHILVIPGYSRSERRRWGRIGLLLLLLSTSELSTSEIRSVSRVYHAASLERGQSHWDYENFPLSSVKWEQGDGYEVIGRLGYGRFSEVLEGIATKDQHRVVLKVLKPARSYKIKREIRVLQLLAGGPNILNLEGVCRDLKTATTTLILEHLGDGAQWFGHMNASVGGTTRSQHVPKIEVDRNKNTPQSGAIPRDIGPGGVFTCAGVRKGCGDAYHGDGNRGDMETSRGGRKRTSKGEDETHLDSRSDRLSDYEVRLYLYKLLQALDYAHSNGIMHRDVKPRNIVINRRTRCLRLIDWGLGDFYIPGRRNMARVGSRYYKAPELLMGFRFYDYAVDIFSVGCMLAGFLLNREPFFRGKDNEDQLVRIALVLGTQDLHEFLRKYEVSLEPHLLERIGTHTRKAWTAVEGGGMQIDASQADGACVAPGLDLLDRMLCYDHQERISAGEALLHPFFDPVRREAADLGDNSMSDDGSDRHYECPASEASHYETPPR